MASRRHRAERRRGRSIARGHLELLQRSFDTDRPELTVAFEELQRIEHIVDGAPAWFASCPLTLVEDDPETLAVGQEVELVLTTLYEDDDHEYVVWQWAPAR